MPMNELLTPFGKDLEKAVRTRTELKDNLNEEQALLSKKNAFRLEQTRQLLTNSDSIVIVGPGPISNKDLKFLIKLQQKNNVASIFSQWANFRDCLEPQILASCHVNPLMASLLSSNPPSTVTHGAYVSSPPVLSKNLHIEMVRSFFVFTSRKRNCRPFN